MIVYCNNIVSCIYNGIQILMSSGLSTHCSAMAFAISTRHQMGFLCDLVLHAIFDGYSLGVTCCCSESKYVIHCFIGDRTLMPYHGQEIKCSISSQSGKAPDRHSDMQCLAWHYAQCVLTRFRGYYVLHSRTLIANNTESNMVNFKKLGLANILQISIGLSSFPRVLSAWSSAFLVLSGVRDHSTSP